MTAFELPVTDGKPLNIMDFKVDLIASPPEIQHRSIEAVDQYISMNSEALCIDYKDAQLDEGRLNIYLCRFQTGKFRLHIIGKIRGQEFRTEREIKETQSNSWGTLNQKINYVLVSSRNILRTYYISSNIKSIENHLMAFIVA
ncbi:MAG: hypothetical protein K0S44_1158 [Bacteroidetes bacterium]|jgi:hypothetical protein|nr:hypothetical protein [Bacteroidota bacterium]